MSKGNIQSPGAYIRQELERRELSQRELAEIMGRPFQMLNELIQGKRTITTDTAIALGAALGTGPEIWLQRDAEYQLSISDVDAAPVKRRARLFELAPIKEMERRQWIKATSSIDEMEGELMRFFNVASLDTIPAIGAVAKKTDHDEPLTPSQRAWCFRVKQIAKSILVGEFQPDDLERHMPKLRKIAAYPQEAHKVVTFLASIGIRLVVVEPLAGAKVDGIALWLDDASPVIGLSIRYDRIDSFWHTLCHEMSHIAHRDESPLDSDLTDKMAGGLRVKSPIERRADDEAAAMLIPPAELESFIRRVGPLYSKDRIGRFANRIKMHPGIIVGQLQHRGEIGFHANREMLAKIRHVITPAAVTDGWGVTIDPRTFS
jgi:HTH-type transcriptional regulator/antitoxin HigA